MKLTNKTFNSAIKTLHNTYLNWELTEAQATIWKKVLELSISDELLPKVILSWMINVTTPPKNPAEIIKHASDMITNEYDSADTTAEILIDSARKAYRVSDDFLAFVEQYDDSFAALIGNPAEDAYIRYNINKRSSNPKILIVVYDEYKGALKECFTGDAEHGIEFLRTQIKKSWSAKTVVVAKAFLTSGQTEVITSKKNPDLFSDGNPSNYLEA